MDKEKINITSNQSTEKVMLVLEALAKQDQPVKLIDLSRETKMNSSTLYRFLVALQNTGYVIQHESSGKYELNLKICYLSDLVKSRFSIATALHSFVVEASALFFESAHLAEKVDNKIVYIDNVTATSQSLVIRQHIGKTAPLHCTGIGKLFLSEYDDSTLDSFIEDIGIPAYTQHTFSTKGALKEELRMIREQGVSYDNEECEIGVRCIAVPIRDYTGKTVAGLSISGPTSRITKELISSNLSAFIDIANRASAELGFPATGKE